MGLILIYLFGAVITYIVFKACRGANEWIDIIATFYFASIWFVALPLLLVCKFFEGLNFKDPPKWL